jgi:hypothetical protein
MKIKKIQMNALRGFTQTLAWNRNYQCLEKQYPRQWAVLLSYFIYFSLLERHIVFVSLSVTKSVHKTLTLNVREHIKSYIYTNEIMDNIQHMKINWSKGNNGTIYIYSYYPHSAMTQYTFVQNMKTLV